MARAMPQHSRTATKAHVPSRQRHKPPERRASARQRGYTKEWEKFRRSFLRDNPLCEYCLARGHVEPATVCDHDLPHDSDPDLFWNNTFTALCAPDHNSTKQRMERMYQGDALLAEIAKAKRIP